MEFRRVVFRSGGGRGGEDGVGGVGVEAAQALGQGVVEGTQGAGAPEGVEEGCGFGRGPGGHVGDLCCAGFVVPSPQPLSRRVRDSSPANRASRAYTRPGSSTDERRGGKEGGSTVK